MRSIIWKRNNNITGDENDPPGWEDHLFWNGEDD